MTPERHQQLRDAYMFTFDVFATGRTELAEALDISKSSALTILKKLEQAHIVTRFDTNEEAQGVFRRGAFKELTWQCMNTYDSFTREEALAEFLEAFPAP